LLKRLVAIISFWRWIMSREILPEAPAGGGDGTRPAPGYPVRTLLERDVLPPPKPYSTPAHGFSLRTLLARETLPPPRGEHPRRYRSIVGFLIARESLPRLTSDAGREPIIEHRE